MTELVFDRDKSTQAKTLLKLALKVDSLANEVIGQDLDAVEHVDLAASNLTIAAMQLLQSCCVEEEEVTDVCVED